MRNSGDERPVLDYLKRLVRLVRSDTSRFPPPWSPPEDPDSRVREPRGRRPSGGSASIALAEPDDDAPLTLAVGRRHPQ